MESSKDTKKYDSPVEETFDSWTILGNSGILPISGNVTVLVNDDDVAHKEDKNSSIVESVEIKSSNVLQVPDAEDNDSDGISVISENDIYKNRDAEDDKNLPKLHINKFAMKNLLNDVLEEEQPKYEPITPPQTPYERKSTSPEKIKKSTSSEKKQTSSEKKLTSAEKKIKIIEKQLLKVNNQGIQTALKKPPFSFRNPSRADSFRICMVFTLTGILVATFGLVHNVKVDSHTASTNYEHRITNLLLENQLLRVKLEIMELQNKQKQQQSIHIEEPTMSIIVDEALFSPIAEEADAIEEKPTIVTKQVYSGDEDKIIDILDSRFLLPAYCYNTDEDDLFHDYNVHNCQRKKKKLANKLRFLHKDKSTTLMEQFGLQDGTEDKSKIREMKPLPKFDIFDLLNHMNKDEDDELDDEPTDTLVQPIVEKVQEIKYKQPSFDNQKENVQNFKDKQQKNDKPLRKRKIARPDDNIGDVKDFEEWKEKSKKLPRLKNKKKGEFESSGSGEKKSKDADYKCNRKTDKATKRDEKVGEWSEKRGSARDEARKQKKENKSNWVLERGNERE
ncbi:unnamed protein product [Diamesa tonsa]